MNCRDSFYTPPDLAKRLIQYIGKQKINNVVDFCVGNGELLRAASARWPYIRFFGIDISKSIISNVKKSQPNWVLSRTDFLNSKSRKQCKVLKSNLSGFDLILLNPPFSCIGGSIHTVEIDNQVFTASTSMKFLTESVKFLSKNGSLYSIMPISSAYSQKDKKLWSYLSDKYDLKILEAPNGSHFKDCSASVLFISINAGSKVKSVPVFKKISLGPLEYVIFRGNLSMHSIRQTESHGKYVIHTTNLLNNEVAGLNVKSKKKSSIINGPAVLIPRVGEPNRKKIAFIKKGASYVLSDCILAIKTRTNKDADYISALFQKNWKSLKGLYKGTGAKYITIDRLNDFLK